MRVLLPLRKVSANKQSSNSSLSDEDEEAARETASTTASESDQNVLVTLPPELLSGTAESPEVVSAPVDCQLQKEEQQSKFDLISPLKQPGNETSSKGKWKTTGLLSASETPTDTPALASSPLIRKRRVLPAGGDLKSCKKRPALDRKPPARDLSMVSGCRRAPRVFHNDDCLRDSSSSTGDENNPASARGDNLVNDDQDLDFYLALKKRGLEIREQEGDGNCLFRAVSLQVYGDPSMHGDVRRHCMDFMDRDREHFAQFVTGEPFDQYIQRKRQDGVHGNNPEIQAMSELFNRPLEVFCPDNGATPLNIFHAEYKTDDAPIRLSYHDGNHYNAVVDPLVPTAGLGLGLPGLQPGLADKMQVAKAVAESDAVADQMEFKKALKDSEDDELQRAIKESKLSAEHKSSNQALALSDMDATYFELEQAALEQSLRSSNLEQGKKQKASSGRRRRHGRNSPSDAVTSENDVPSSSDFFSSSQAVASLPTSFGGAPEARIPAAAAAASVASAASASAPAAAKRDDSPPPAMGTTDAYPQTVQELVMNGFDPGKVQRAYELIGDNFDDLLSFLMSQTG